MAQTKEGAAKAAKKIKKLYGKEYYSNIGAIGGKTKSDSKGFGYRNICRCELIIGSHHNARCAGMKGGTISKRRKNAAQLK